MPERFEGEAVEGQRSIDVAVPAPTDGGAGAGTYSVNVEIVAQQMQSFLQLETRRFERMLLGDGERWREYGRVTPPADLLKGA